MEKTESKQKTKRPAYYEIEQFRRGILRWIWGGMGVLALTTGAALFLALTAVAKPTPVIEYDCAGEPRIYRDTYQPAMSTNDVRLNFFLEEFSKCMVLVDASGRKLEKGFQCALAMMTPKFAEITAREGLETERRLKYQGSNIYSEFEQLEFILGDFEEDAETIYFYWFGEEIFLPLEGRVAPENLVRRWNTGRGSVKRKPVTVRNPHGLQISYFEYDTYDNREDYDLAVLKLKRE